MMGLKNIIVPQAILSSPISRLPKNGPVPEIENEFINVNSPVTKKSIATK